jgi:hypothetical protein
VKTTASLKLRFAHHPLSALAAGSTRAFAQKFFFNKLETGTGQSPQSAAVGEFNEDGPAFLAKGGR